MAAEASRKVAVTDNGMTDYSWFSSLRFAPMVFSSLETGFHSIAVPLRRWDDIQIAALNVGSNIERLPADDMFQRVLPVLQATARKLQPQLV